MGEGEDGGGRGWEGGDEAGRGCLLVSFFWVARRWLVGGVRGP